MAEKIFIVSGGGNTRPLWRPLSERVPLGFLYQQAENEARAAGIGNLVSIGQYVTPDIQERALNDVALTMARVVNDMPETVHRMTAAYGSDAPHNLNGNFTNWWYGFLQPRLSAQIMTLAVMEKLAQEREIVGCLVHEDVTPDTRSLVNFCNARNIPTLHLPHAACHLLPGVEDIHRQTRTRTILSSGQYMSMFYATSGFPPENIIQVGIPEWDGLKDMPMPDKAEARRVLGISDSKFVVLYGTTWGQTTSLRSRFEDEFQETHEAVINLCRERDAYLIINCHPNEAPQMESVYVELLKKNRLRGMVTRQHEVYLVRAADVVVKHGPSNFCIKVAIMGRPSCYVQTEGFDFNHPLPPRGGVGGLPVLVDAALSIPPEGWQDFIRYYDCAFDEDDATERAMKAIEATCRLQFASTLTA